MTSASLPEPSAEPIRWGVLATGKIAHSFARDLALVPGGRLAAVGSRRPEAATSFAAEHGDDQTRAHGSYAGLVADPDVDVVYVATPHALHPDDVRLALEAGKHVLCEKPVALRERDAAAIIDLARERGLFFMEAMWTACHPVVRELIDVLATGRFGTPRQVQAELGFRVDAPPEDRLLAPELGGGALLDMGIYPLTFAHLVLGEAEQLTATAGLASSGIDLDIAIAGRYAGGAVAALGASMSSWSSRRAAIATDEGRIEVGAQFHHPDEAVFTPHGPAGPRPEERVVLTGREPVIGRGYGNEIAEVQRCLREGLTESPLVPHAQTLTIMRQMDDLRAQVGVAYPGD